MTALRRLLGGLLVALVAVAVAWSPPPGRPSSFDPPPPGPGSEVGPQVRHPWQPGRPELGIQVLFVDQPEDSVDVLRLKARYVLDRVVDLEANAISVTFPFFTDSTRADSVRPDIGTPSPVRLGVLVDEAARRGLRITLRPLLDEANLMAVDPADWRGVLRPGDRDAWFASYRALLRPYLQLAEHRNVAEFVLGAEFSSLESDRRWAALADDARSIFPGLVSYTANWDVPRQVRAALPVDRVAIDAYPVLPLPADPSVEQLTAAWTTWLNSDGVRADSTTVISEVGIAAQVGAFGEPYLPTLPGAAPSESTQQRWFAAACRAARERDLSGIYWWRVDIHLDLAEIDPDSDRADSFDGRAGESEIRRCFTEWGSAL